jgi:hypothetical protein
MRKTLLVCVLAAAGCAVNELGSTEQAVKNPEIEARKDALCKVTACTEETEEVRQPFTRDGCESTWSQLIHPFVVDPEAGVCTHSFEFYYWELKRVEADDDGAAICVFERTQWKGTWSAPLTPDETCPAPEDGDGDDGK